MRRLLAILLLLTLTACIPSLRMAIATEPVPPDTYTQCGWMWASYPLPETSDQVQALLRRDVQAQAQAYAQSYGEDCFGQDGQVLYFVAMQTDFYVTLKVSDLNDPKTLADLLEKTVIALLGIPPEDLAGEQHGYLGLTFTHGNQELRLWFRLDEAEALLMQGVQGPDLLEALQE